MECNQHTVVVFLVHGTFASNAPWTCPGSRFRAILACTLKNLGYDTVYFRNPDWGGGNSHEARRAGAAILARKFMRSVRSFPNAHHFVVAHSHGGNVALLAIRRSKVLREHGVGIVFLATPFLKFHELRATMITLPIICINFFERLLDLAKYLYLPFVLLFHLLWSPFRSISELFNPSKRDQARADLPFSVGFFFLLLILYWLGFWAVQHWGATPGEMFSSACMWATSGASCDSIGRRINLVLVIVGLLGLLGLLGLFINTIWVAVDKYLQEQRYEISILRQQIFRRYAYSQPEHSVQIPTLVLSSSVDEALGLLHGAWMMHRWTSWIARSIAFVVLFSAVWLSGALVSWLTRLLTTPTLDPWLRFLLWDQGFGFAIIIAGIVMAYSVGSAVKLLGLLAGSTNLGLGLAKPDHNLLWTVRASRSPGLGDWEESTRYGFREMLSDSHGWLFHSRLYSHTTVIRRVGRWMDGIVCQGNTTIENR